MDVCDGDAHANFQQKFTLNKNFGMSVFIFIFLMRLHNTEKFLFRFVLFRFCAFDKKTHGDKERDEAEGEEIIMCFRNNK